jgi:HEAT repeat protein
VEQLINVIDYGNHERFEETVHQSDMFDWEVSIAAAEALGKIGDTSAVKPLINMLEAGASNRYEDRSGLPATIALGAIGDSRAIEPLLTELWNVDDDLDDPNNIREGGRIPEWYACQVVPEALTQIGDKSVIESLIGFLHYRDTDSDWWTPELAAEALTGLGWKPETEDLKAAYFVATKDWEGCKQLGKLGTEKAIEYLVPLLYYRDSMHGFGYHHEIEEAFESFGEMAIEPLVKLLTSGYQGSAGSESAVICEALGRIGEPAVEPLIKALGDEDDDVRASAKEVLQMLGHEVE